MHIVLPGSWHPQHNYIVPSLLLNAERTEWSTLGVDVLGKTAQAGRAAASSPGQGAEEDRDGRRDGFSSSHMAPPLFGDTGFNCRPTLDKTVPKRRAEHSRELLPPLM